MKGEGRTFISVRISGYVRVGSVSFNPRSDPEIVRSHPTKQLSDSLGGHGFSCFDEDPLAVG
jgi:hypothetical protein